MKGTRIREILQARGLTVWPDEAVRGFVVCHETNVVLARYDLTEDGHFRFGWTITANGRQDANDWQTFDIQLQELVAFHELRVVQR